MAAFIVYYNSSSKVYKVENTCIPTHKIPKDVEAVKIGHLAASVDVAASNRLADFMWVSKNGKDIILGKSEINKFRCLLSYLHNIF